MPKIIKLIAIGYLCLFGLTAHAEDGGLRFAERFMMSAKALNPDSTQDQSVLTTTQLTDIQPKDKSSKRNEPAEPVLVADQTSPHNEAINLKTSH